MNLPDPAPYATPAAQAFTQASAMVNTFGTTTPEAAWALQKWQTEYLRMLEPRVQPAPGQPRPESCQRSRRADRSHRTTDIPGQLGSIGGRVT